jgi:hypothetical protein
VASLVLFPGQRRVVVLHGRLLPRRRGPPVAALQRVGLGYHGPWPDRFGTRRRRLHPARPGALRDPDDGRPGRRDRQDRARQGRLDAPLEHGEPLHRGRGRLLPQLQPQQAVDRDRPQAPPRQGGGAAPGRPGRRGDRELPARGDGAARPRLRDARRAQPAHHLLRQFRAGGSPVPTSPGPGRTSSCRRSPASAT